VRDPATRFPADFGPAFATQVFLPGAIDDSPDPS
jgi:hypothetical protein